MIHLRMEEGGVSTECGVWVGDPWLVVPGPFGPVRQRSPHPYTSEDNIVGPEDWRKVECGRCKLTNAYLKLAGKKRAIVDA